MADRSSLWRDRTTWSRERAAPLRAFLWTESGSAGVLLAAAVAALVWANVDLAGYESVWHAHFSISLGDTQVDRDVRTWINSGLMTLFFLVVGLEARREFDLGDLRERRRFALPCLAGIVGMAVPASIYLALNAGHSSAHGWGVAMSTDTALALGLLALLGRDVPDRVRVFLLTVSVVDDLIALAVIAVVYSDGLDFARLGIAVAVFAALLVAAVRRVQRRWVYVGLGLAMWSALLASGVDPIVTGLAIGLSAPAYSPPRERLEQATELVRSFREQPTSELARSASAGLTSALSPNERLQTFFHPWTSYLIVPLFALANAGIELNPDFLGTAYTSPITLGVLIGYVIGKPVALMATSSVMTRLSHGRIRPPVGWAAVLGSGTIAGIGFTVALLIADRAFSGAELAEAKLGALSAAVVSSLLTWMVYRLTGLLSPARRIQALQGDVRLIQDLIPEVDPERDHIRGPHQAAITVIEFGDFECPFCGQAEPVVRELLGGSDLRFVWRHLPLPDVHPAALLAAEASEAAAAQGRFWEMHDLLLDHQENLTPADLVRYAGDLGLDVERFHDDLRRHVYETRVAQDVESADVSGATGTPTFFVNGQRHYGAYDLDSLAAAVAAADAQLRSAGDDRG
ncbi:Na+/H+ antiporter NhaA [Nocardioides sp.]|jgi:Na+/H+ antiporter NhaA|uniref:Na+/H+ antiporter NhaA n=1 Tax=Nocardioides sp. TaxID=35761 RepID=UPI002F42EF95